jgi:aerobic-type carbon monoxide dehydrogenase small subunit (CoxS/CutS family)
MNVTLIVNGESRTVTTEADRTLLDVLREDLDLTGTKYGCGEGMCGACTVLMDGDPIRTCVTSVARADGKRITTIEGLANGDSLHPVQKAFLEDGVVQCGYCTPGMILTAVALLEQNPDPSENEIVDSMNDVMCRCCAYPELVTAIRRAAQLSSGGNGQ